jgi:hypothetical protein
MVRYSFPAGISHPLQHAGLSRRSGLSYLFGAEGLDWIGAAGLPGWAQARD